MAKVISLPKDRFITTGVTIPHYLDFIFSETRNENEIVELCKYADFIFASSGTTYISAGTIKQINTIRMIQIDGVGYEKVDVEFAAEHNLPVANNAGVNSTTVAESALGMIIALQRRYLIADKWIKQGRYEEMHRRFVAEGLHELADKKVGLIGLGAIGTELAKLLHILNADIYYYDLVWKSPEVEAEIGIKRMTLDDILTECDIVSLHTPLTEQTKNMINEKALLKMKKSAILINTSRGEIIVQTALAKVLESGHLAGVGIDTIYPEPPSNTHPLLNLSKTAKERIMLTPHIAGVTLGAFKRMLVNSIDNFNRALADEPLINVVNGIPKARNN